MKIRRRLPARTFENDPDMTPDDFVTVDNGFGGSTTMRRSEVRPSTRVIVPAPAPAPEIPARVQTAQRRLGVSLAVAMLVTDRNVKACERVVELLQARWEAAPVGSCCKRNDGEYHMACEHLRRLWDAKAYLILAKVGAPTDQPAWACAKCNGSGKFHGGGMVLNGRFTGYVGVCYACKGKGWLTADDRKRNDNYWKYFARI